MRHLQTVDVFGWHSLERGKLLEICAKLRHLESMTWNELLIGSKKQYHEVTCDQLSPLARKRLSQLKLDDYESLLSVRLSGVERIWGFRDQGVLHLIFWDPEHQVCPSPKKHT